MITCPKCKKKLKDDVRFCDACGTQIFKAVICPNCGAQTSTEFAFCKMCGTPIVEDPEVSATSKDPVQEKRKRKRQKAVLFAALGMIAFVTIILFATKFSSGSRSKDNYKDAENVYVDHSKNGDLSERKENDGLYLGLYLKDGEIVYTDYSEDGDWVVTSQLLNGMSMGNAIDELEDSGRQNYLTSNILSRDLTSFIKFNQNGNRIFYPDCLDIYADGITLYYRDIDKPDKNPVKIDSDVCMYAINSNGTQVIYVKGSNHTLYLHDLNDKQKIDSEVSRFDVSNDLKKIGYQKADNSYYIWYADKNAVKVASNVTTVEHIAVDLSSIYFMKDDSLYKWVESSEEREKIASHVFRVLRIYDSGEVYYARLDEKNLMDYIDDDMAASDAVLTEPPDPTYPEAPAEPSGEDYETYEEYNAALEQYLTKYEAYETACNQISTDYDVAYNEYLAKCNRDSLREELQNTTMETQEYALYYFDGAKETMLTSALTDCDTVVCSRNKPVIVFEVYNKSNVPKVKLSEISLSDEVSKRINAVLDSSSECYVAVGPTLSIFEHNNATDFRLSFDGSIIYFLDNISENNEGDLYKVAITNGQVGEPELYDSDVSMWKSHFIHGGTKFAYYKDFDSERQKGDLFIDGEEIDYDVRYGSAIPDDETVYYYTDWNSDERFGTLKAFKNGSRTKIADDVHDYDITSTGDIRYLNDYSTDYYTGTLYLYNNGEPRKIDDDVFMLIPIPTPADYPLITAQNYSNIWVW